MIFFNENYNFRETSLLLIFFLKSTSKKLRMLNQKLIKSIVEVEWKPDPIGPPACYHSTTFLELATIFGPPPPNLLELKGVALIKL